MKKRMTMPTLLATLFFLVSGLGLQAQNLFCNADLNVEPDPITCDVVICPDNVLEGDPNPLALYTITVTGLDASCITNNGVQLVPAAAGAACVTIDANCIYDFRKNGMDSFTVAISGVLAGASLGSCWNDGWMIEDKTDPIIECPVATTVECTESILPATTGTITVTDCSDVTKHYTDEVTEGVCSPGTDGTSYKTRIVRTWYAKDAKGNTSIPCTQDIEVEFGTIADLDIPEDAKLECDLEGVLGACAPDDVVAPGWNVIAADAGFPNSCDCIGNPSPDAVIIDGCVILTGTGRPNATDGLCDNLFVTFKDLKLETPGCPNSYKIQRTWTIIDWCKGTDDDKIQYILVDDTKAPTITCPTAPIKKSTTTNSCEATFFVDPPAATDLCSDGISWTAEISAGTISKYNGNYIVQGLPVANDHTILWTAADDCGNIATCLVEVEVTDDIAPVAICETEHTVSLTGYTNDDENITLVPAEAFNDGSYDNCEIKSIRVRRMAGTSCIDFDWTTDGPGIDEEDNGCFDNRDKGELAAATAAGVVDCAHGLIEDYPAVPFACCDLDGTHLVEFRVTDIYDNVNTCMVNVTVQDKLDPVITCPPVATYPCSVYNNSLRDFPIDGLNQDGEGAPAFYVHPDGTEEAVGHYAKAYDNCDVTVYISDNGTVNSCGITEGPNHIRRTYKAVDGGGREESCVQTIEVENNDPFFIKDDNCANDLVAGVDVNLDDVNWPCDVEDFCDDAASDWGAPIVNDTECSLIAVTYTDLFDHDYIADGACKKILRTWTVIDWCQYDNDIVLVDLETGLGNVKHPGLWEYEQIIKIFDNVDPVITSSCEDQYFAVVTDNDGNPDNGCTAPVTLTLEATDVCSDDLNYEYWIDWNDDGTQDVGGAASSYTNPAVEMGTHRIYWSVEDGCGNVSKCDYAFSVEDKTPPYIFYAQDYVTELVSSTSTVTVWATEFLGTYGDECSGICEFRIGVPSLGPGQNAPPITDSYEFSLDDAANTPVDWWIKDCAGNWAYVTGNVQIQDNNGAPSASIAGAITTELNEAVSNVSLDLTGNAPGMDATLYSNESGEFEFNTLPLNYNYTISPSMNVEPLNGVSTFDLVLISKHILNIQKLDSPYKMIAADINNSGKITTIDMVELRKLILFINTEFQNNTSWRFVDADYVFNDVNNPWVSIFPEVTNINELTANEIADYVGIKVGDVNGSAASNGLVGGEDRSTVGDLVFALDNQKMVAGKEYTVEFKASDFANVTGYQFTIAFDQSAVEFVDVNAGNLAKLSDANFGLSKVNDGVITTSWNNADAISMKNNESVFSVTFTAKSNAQLSDVLSVSSRYTAAEAYNAELELMNVAIEYNNNGTVAAAGFELLQNTPNPFKDETVIGFSLPEANTATLKVYDVTGRVLKSVEGEFAKGYNEVSLNRSELSATGVLYYTLESANDSATKKMIIVD